MTNGAQPRALPAATSGVGCERRDCAGRSGRGCVGLGPDPGQHARGSGHAALGGVIGHRSGPEPPEGHHLRALEAHGLVATVEERTWGGITERFMQAVATRLVVSPAALQPNVIDPTQAGDVLSASYLIAVSGRAVCEVGDITARAADAGQRLPTLTIDTTVGFVSAAERAAPMNSKQGSLRLFPVTTTTTGDCIA
jgi:hypothetical protein